MRSRCCLCVSAYSPSPPLTFEWLNKSLWNLVRISWHLSNPSRQSVCLYVYPLIVARQRLGKNPLIVAMQRLGRNVTAVTNTYATIEELLDASFSMLPVSHQGKVGDSFFPELLVLTYFTQVLWNRSRQFPSYFTVPSILFFILDHILR
jgi:hypothetical protein